MLTMMNIWIIIFHLLYIIISFTNCQTLLFRELSSKKPYSANHIYRSLDNVSFRDSIMYYQDSNYVLINTNNFIVKLDINSMNVMKELPVLKDQSISTCFIDKYAEKYPCHLYGYWSKIIPMDSGRHQLFICNNNGETTYYDIKTMDKIITNTRQNCHYDSIMTLLSSDKYFYVADIKRSPMILRFNPDYPKDIVYRKKNNFHSSIDSSWLQQNDYLQFVFIFENGNYVYLLLKEIAEEEKSICYVKNVKSRIVRISKEDTGGTNYILKDVWISFLKATILCPDKSQKLTDSYFNHVESGYFDHQRQLLYATFSYGSSGPPSTTLCQYSIRDIETALEGPYANLKNPRKAENTAFTVCENKPDCASRTVRYQLKFWSVLPNMKRNLIVQDDEIWSHVQVLTIDRSSKQYDIIFVASSSGHIKKYYRKLTDNFLCYSETLDLSLKEKEENMIIRDMKLINSKQSTQPFLMVTLDKGIYKIGIEHCLIHSKESNCIDPFCYWNIALNTCTSIFTIPVYQLRQLPELKYCSNGKEFIDPIMEQWSTWKNCGMNGNYCQCRVRDCKVGQCTNEENLLQNSEIQVRNCTDNHKWSSWSPWSDCSSKCGEGKSFRRRWCFENGNCPGKNTEEKLCFIENHCKSAIIKSEWSEWSGCSSKCGQGVISRTRPCQNDKSKDGLPNEKCLLIDYKECHEINCINVSKRSPEMILMRNSGREYFIANCTGLISENDDEIITSLEYDIKNYSIFSNYIWSCWNDWSRCGNECINIYEELATRYRYRQCKLNNDSFMKKLCYDVSKESEDCIDNLCLKPSSIKGEKKYQLIFIIMVGVASFTASCIIVVAITCIYFAKKKIITKYTQATYQSHSLTRQSYMRESYSPIQQSPIHTPLDLGWVPSEGYTSLSRGNIRQNKMIQTPVPQIA